MQTRPRAIGEYLRQLDRSLQDLPRDRRREIVSEIEEHIEALLAEAGHAPSESEIRNVLERVGDPRDIAAEAHDRLAVPASRSSWTDTAAVVLLAIPFVGWIIGAVLLWTSDVWQTRDKVIGTLAGPGLIVFGLLLTIAASGGGGSTEVGGGGEVPGGGGLGPIEVLVLALLFVVPIAAAIYLGQKLRRYRLAAR
jgi:uncharacterized protein YneF (UPF0154 family)